MSDLMFVFLPLPIRLVSLHDLRWGDNGISKDHLGEPERRREIDDEPIWVEQLVSGHLFVHDGRHRCLRAIARGEHEIYAHALMNSLRRTHHEAQALPESPEETKGTESTIFPLF